MSTLWKGDPNELRHHQAVGQGACRGISPAQTIRRNDLQTAPRRSSECRCRPSRSRPTPPNRMAPLPGIRPRWCSSRRRRRGTTGIGYSYADTATATLIRDTLSEVVRGRDAHGRAGPLGRDGAGHSQSRPPRHCFDGHCGGRYGALGPEGPPPECPPGHAVWRGPRRACRYMAAAGSPPIRSRSSSSSSAAGPTPGSRA